MVLVDPPVLDELELLFERDAWWIRDAGAIKPELKKEWELLRDEFPALQMTVPTVSLRVVKFGREVILKNKSLVEEIRVLRKTGTGEQAVQKVFEDELMKLKGLVSASDKLTEELAESDKSLESARTEEPSLKEEVKRANEEKAKSKRVIDKGREESEQRTVRLNVALVGRNRA